MFGTLTGFDGSLFDEFRRMQQDLDEAFGRDRWPAGIRSVARGTFPPINVGVTPHKVEVYVFASGLDPKEMDITIQQNVLTVSGERRAPAAEGEGSYYRQERYYGGFRRVITLPDDVDPHQVDARYEEGVLHISIQRKAEAQPRRIEVS